MSDINPGGATRGFNIADDGTTFKPPRVEQPANGLQIKVTPEQYERFRKKGMPETAAPKVTGGEDIRAEHTYADVLLEEYPAYADRIKKARAHGVSDNTIYKVMAERERKALEHGSSQETVDRSLGRNAKTKTTVYNEMRYRQSVGFASVTGKPKEEIEKRLSVAQVAGVSPVMLVENDDLYYAARNKLEEQGFKLTEGTWQQVSNAYQADKLQNEKAKIYTSAAMRYAGRGMTGAILSPEDETQIEYIDTELAKLAPPVEQTVMQEMAAGASSLFSQQVATQKTALLGGTIAGGIGLVTGGLPGAKTAAPLGYATGAALQGANREFAGALEEYLQIKDKDGNAINPQIALLLAAPFGLASGAVEFVQWKGLGRMLGRGVSASTAAKAMATPTIRDAVLGALTESGIDYTKEVSQEVLQRAIVIMGRELSKRIAGGDFQTASASEIVGELAEEGRGAALSFAIPGILGGGGNVARSVHANKAAQTKNSAQAGKTPPGPVTLEEERQAAHRAAQDVLRGVNGTEEAVLREERLQEAARVTGMDADVLRQAADVVDLEDRVMSGELEASDLMPEDSDAVFVPKEAVEAYFQTAEESGMTREQAALQLGIDPDQYLKQGAGEEVMLNAQAFDEAVQSNPEIAQTFGDDVRRGASGRTVREVLDEKRRDLQRLLEDPLHADTQDARDALNLRDSIAKQARDAGVKGREADDAATLWANHALIVAQEMGVSVEEASNLIVQRVRPDQEAAFRQKLVKENVASYGRPLNPDVDLNQRVPIFDATALFPEAANTDKATLLSHLHSLEGRTFSTASGEKIIRILKKIQGDKTKKDKSRHVVYSIDAMRSAFPEARNAGILSIEKLIGNAVLVESEINTKRSVKPNASAYHRFYVPMRIGDSLYTVRLVAEEMDEGLRFHPDETVLYDMAVDKKMSLPVQSTPVTERDVDAKEASLSTTIRDMLSGVKDASGDSYAQQQDDKLRGTFHTDPATGQRVISLFQSKNKSTFVHEIGHAMLEDLKMMAEREGSSEGIRQGWETMKDWLGFEEGQAGITREQHEKFADGFLNYIETGKAPIKSLRGVFERFRGWLRRLFRIGQIQRIEMSDEVRAVYDSLLATQAKMDEEAVAQMTVANIAEEEIMREREIAQLERVERMLRSDTNVDVRQLENMIARQLRAEDEAARLGREVHDDVTIIRAYSREVDKLIGKKAKLEDKLEKTQAVLRDAKARARMADSLKRRIDRSRERAAIAKETSKIVRDMVRASKDKKVIWEKREQIRNAISDYDLKRRAQKTLDKRRDLEAFLDLFPEAAEDISKEELRYLNTTSLSEMTMGELRELHRGIMELRDEGRRELLAKNEAERRAVDRAAKEMLDGIGQVAGRSPVIMGKGDTKKGYTFFDARKDAIRREQATAMAELEDALLEAELLGEEVTEHEKAQLIQRAMIDATKRVEAQKARNVGRGIKRKVEFLTDAAQAALWDRHRLFDLIDGGKATFDGPVYKFFVGAFNRCKDAFNLQIERRTGESFELKMRELELDGNRLNERVLVEGEDARAYFGGDFPTKSQLMGLYTLSKDPDARDAILHGNLNGVPYSDQFFERCIAALAEEEKALADYVFADFNDPDNFERANRAWIETTGEGMTKLDYYVTIFRVERGSYLATVDQGNVQGFLDKGGMPGKADPGFTKERVKFSPGSQTAIETDLMKVWIRHVQEEEHFIAYAETLKMARSILFWNDPDNKRVGLARGIAENMGEDVYRAVIKYYNDNVTPELFKAQEALDGVLGTMIKMKAVSALWGNIGVYLKNFAGMGKWFFEANPVDILGSLYDYWTNRKDFYERVFALDPQLAERKGNVVYEMMRQDPDAKQRKIDSVVNAGMEPNAMIDRWVSSVMFDSIVKSEMRLKGKTLEQAARTAQEAVQRNMQPTSQMELPDLWRRGGPWRAMLLFSSEGAKALNILLYDVPRRFAHNGTRADALRMAVGMTLAAMVLNVIAHGGPDDDDDESWAEWLAMGIAEGTIGSIPVIGEEIMQELDGQIYSQGKSMASEPFWQLFAGFRDAFFAENKITRAGLTKRESGTLAILNGYSLLQPFPYVMARKVYMAGKARDAADAALILTGNRDALRRTREKAYQEGRMRRY